MPTFSVTKDVEKHVTRSAVKVPYILEEEVDFAKALVAKGSALAAADVIELIKIPAGSIVLAGGLQVKTPANSTTLTLHLGTAVDPDEWAVSLDGKTAGSTSLFVARTLNATDTVDVTLATLTGTLSAGVVRAWVLVSDVSDVPNPGLALLKS